MKTTTKMMRVTATREVYPWILLWNRCTWALEDASSGKDREYLYIFSMVLCAFTLEAFLNHLLRFRRPADWAEYERRATPAQKLSELCRIIGFKTDRRLRPFSTFSEVFRFRNGLAHAKPITLARSFDYPIDTFLTAHKVPPFPLTSLERALRPATARRFHKDSGDMILALYGAADMGDKPFDETYSRTHWEGTL
jgi:hypothetical protein